MLMLSLSHGPNRLFYLFPPFSIMALCLQKLEEDGGEAILVAPVWATKEPTTRCRPLGATQQWYPRLLGILTAHPLIVPPSRHLLTLPGINR